MILDFERPIRDLEERITGLHKLAGKSEEMQEEISNLEDALENAKKRIYANLTPYQRVQVARHPERPGFRAYRDALADDFYELSGDRSGGDDPAVRGGFARLKHGGRNVVLIGHDKGAETKSRVAANFGMAHPEGYRKVKRLYGLAERFGLPIVTLVDTPGAFSGRKAEEQGQAWAISEDLMALARSRVPVVSLVIGEGGSGGGARDVSRGLRRDAGEFVSLRNSPRSLRLDHLPRLISGRRGGGVHEDHGPRPQTAGHRG